MAIETLIVLVAVFREQSRAGLEDYFWTRCSQNGLMRRGQESLATEMLTQPAAGKKDSRQIA